MQGFAKGLLDVADNLQRAADSVPPEVLAEGAEVDKERALQLLKGLLEGVQITNKVLLQVSGAGTGCCCYCCCNCGGGAGVWGSLAVDSRPRGGV